MQGCIWGEQNHNCSSDMYLFTVRTHIHMHIHVHVHIERKLYACTCNYIIQTGLQFGRAVGGGERGRQGVAPPTPPLLQQNPKYGPDMQMYLFTMSTYMYIVYLMYCT